MARTTQPRIQKGVPTGGQFAAATGRETDIPAPIRLGDLPPEEMVSRVERYSRSFARKLGLDADDLRQESLLRLFESMTKAPDRVLDNPNGYIGSVVHSVASRSMLKKRGGNDRVALNALLRIKRDIENDGRTLTATEIDTLAEQIRLQAPPSRRPTQDFHIQVREVSLEERHDTAAPDADTRSDAEMLADDEPFAECDDLASSGQIKQAKKALWPALARAYDLPGLASLSAPAASRIRRSLREAGGVSSVIGRWVDGERSKVTDDLFRPFDAAGQQERYAIADLLMGKAPLTEDIWEAAVSGSVRSVNTASTRDFASA